METEFILWTNVPTSMYMYNTHKKNFDTYKMYENKVKEKKILSFLKFLICTTSWGQLMCCVMIEKFGEVGAEEGGGGEKKEGI